MKKKKLDEPQNQAGDKSQTLSSADMRMLEMSKQFSSAQKAEAWSKEIRLLSLHTFFSVMRKRWFFLAMAWALCMVFLVTTLSLTGNERAVMMMSLNYEEGTNGRNPNGSRFDLSSFTGQDNLQQTIEDAGLQDDMDWQDLQSMINITPYSNSLMKNDMYHINSSYTISLSMPDEYRRIIDPQDLLLIACNNYKKTFLDRTIITALALKDMETDLTGMDYSEIGAYFTLFIDSAQSYLSQRIADAGSFIASSELTYKAINQKLINLQTYDVTNYMSYVWENGVSHNADRQVDTFESINRRYHWLYEQKQQQSEAYQNVVDEYDNAITTSVLIPTYDNTSEFYMARTKTGIDTLSKAAAQCSTTASEYLRQIKINEDKIAKLNKNAAYNHYMITDTMVENISGKIDAIVAQIFELDNEYMWEHNSSYMTFSESHIGLMSRLQIKKSFTLSMIMLAVIYVACVYIKKRKAERLSKWMYAHPHFEKT